METQSLNLVNLGQPLSVNLVAKYWTSTFQTLKSLIEVLASHFSDFELNSGATIVNAHGNFIS